MIGDNNRGLLSSVSELFWKTSHPTPVKRFLFFLFFDILIIVLSLYLSFYLRFDFVLKTEYQRMAFEVLPIFLLIKLASFGFFRLYSITWRYVGLNELFNIARALIMSELALMVLFFMPLPQFWGFLTMTDFDGFPRSIFFIDGTISLILLGGLRISKRLYLEVLRKNGQASNGRNTLIIGAGNTGEMILRDMARNAFSEFYPVGILDDNKYKYRTYLQGAKVLGTIDDLEYVVSKYGVETIIIAIPNLNYKSLRKIYDSAKCSHVRNIKIVPRIYDFQKPDINLKNLEDIQVEDLIGRQMVKVDYKAIEQFLKDRVVLITGAGGSIGSEMTLQVCGFYPAKVILFDNDETSLHEMEVKMVKLFPHLHGKVFFVAGDIKDRYRVDEVFRTFSPQVVFHAAAYKHVPMMESNAKEAVKVNIFGTYNAAKAAVDFGTNKFIMISTDKAVRPTSVMGATKRVAEFICTAFHSNSGTEFNSVRFGNVLGSRGSVLPLFLDQLKCGGPLRVTHKDMKRYFMTIPESVSLVLQASTIGKGGEVLVLDMGEPVKIVSLAEELIRIHGLKPYEDIDIQFFGMRPGEKLFEEVLTAEEGTIASKHDKIFIARNSAHYSKRAIEQILREFEDILKRKYIDSDSKIKDLLRKIVKYYTDSRKHLRYSVHYDVEFDVVRKDTQVSRIPIKGEIIDESPGGISLITKYPLEIGHKIKFKKNETKLQIPFCEGRVKWTKRYNGSYKAGIIYKGNERLLNNGGASSQGKIKEV